LGQDPPHFQTVRIVNAEQGYGSIADPATRFEERSVKGEMLVQDINSWIKQPHQFAINHRGEIATFSAIAWRASVAEVVLCRWPTVLLCDDVINLEAPNRIILMNQGILTKSLCPITNQGSERVRNPAPAHWAWAFC